MPYSSSEGKEWAAAAIADIAPEMVLDIGPGSGTWAHLVGAAHLTCIEIFEPYVDRFHLRDLYDTVIIGDAMTIDWPQADVVILGDVLEHVTPADGVIMWAKARAAVRRAVVLSIPIVDYPQGPSEGNPHEEHLAQWTHTRIMEDLVGVTQCFRGTQIGVYIASIG